MQAAGNTQLMRLVENSGSRLTVEQAAANSLLKFPLHAVLLLSVVLLVFFIATRRWTWIVMPGILLVLSAAMLRPMAAYRLTVDEPSEQVSWGTVDGAALKDTASVPVADLSAAGLQSGKSGSRVVLVHKDGVQQFPLGTNYYMNEPLQLMLTERIQHLITTRQGR